MIKSMAKEKIAWVGGIRATEETPRRQYIVLSPWLLQFMNRTTPKK